MSHATATHHVISASSFAEDITDPTIDPSSARSSARTDVPEHAPALLALLLTLIVVGGGLALWTTLGDGTRLIIMVAVGLATATATLAVVRRSAVTR